MNWITLVIANIAAIAIIASCTAQEEREAPVRADLPKLLELKHRTDELGFANLVRRSMSESEAFRRSLIQHEKQPVPGRTIGKACDDFRKLINAQTASLTGQAEYDLSRFQLNQQQIYDAIRGKRDLPVPEQFYGSFEGKWFGIWDQQEVDHHWGGYQAVEPKQTIEIAGQDAVTLLGYQYAWVGDGYGLNHVASSADGRRKFLLGYVVHIRDRDLDQEVVRRPHVGVIDGPGRLIWITSGEVFFEEMIPGKSRQEDRYFITGFRYSMDASTITATKAFQAVYARNSDQRKPWRGFEINLQVN